MYRVASKAQIRRGTLLQRALPWIAIASLGLGVAMPFAAAQTSAMSSTYFSAGSGRGPQISRADIDVFIRVLELDDVERGVLDDLYAAYIEEWHAGHRAMRAEAAELIEEAEILQDQRRLSEIHELQEQWSVAADRLEKRFLDDVTTMLTAEQEGRWPIVERELRRIKTMGDSRLAGESIDVIRLVGRVLPEKELPERITDLLEQYAEQLDAVLIRRNRLLEEHRPGYSELVKEDPDRAEEVYFRAVRARAAVCDVNERFARQIAAELPEAEGRQLLDAFDEAAYSMYIKPTRLERQILAAENASGVSGERADQVATLIARYRDEVRQMNDREVALRLEIEREHTPAFITSARTPPEDTGWEQFKGWGEDHPLTELRRERLLLDRRYRDQLKELLTEDQFLALPDTAAGGIMFFGYGLDHPTL